MHIQRLGRRSLGRQFGWLWAAYAVSAYGSGIGFGAFPLIAVLVLHSGPVEVSALPAAGLAVGAVVAVPLGPWVEFRRKRPVMMAMDLARFAALMTIPAAYALGWLSFAQLLVVSVVVAAAKIAFNAASGANLKTLVSRRTCSSPTAGSSPRTGQPWWSGRPRRRRRRAGRPGDDRDRRRGQLPAVGLRDRRDRRRTSPVPMRPAASGLRTGELLDGWRHILGSPALRPVFFNRLLVGGLILAAEPLLVVLMLGPLKFAPWQYTLAFGAPCIGGLIGSRLARGLVARFGRHRVMLVSGTLRACWPIGLAFTGSGRAAWCSSSRSSSGSSSAWACTTRCPPPTGSTTRRSDLVARVLAAWSVSTSLATAVLTAGGAGSRASQPARRDRRRGRCAPGHPAPAPAPRPRAATRACRPVAPG